MLAYALEFEHDAVAAWADEYFLPRVEAGVINGASVGVVQDGETVVLRAYGWQDLQRQIPLDPEVSKIRMCSVSKTFTATAILQLRDRGLIESLDDPVNQYLKRYQLPGPEGTQVTLRQLMTHSSGMAGHFTPQGTKLDLAVPVDANEVANMFEENIERPPGAIGQYANLGVALESVVIEDVSGMSMADYVAEHILRPLGMHNSIMHHDTSVPENLVQPYGVFANGDLQAVPFYPKHPLTAASGGIIAPPLDMLKYAAFHADVSGNQYDHVLADASKREMQQPQFFNHPAQDGIGLHFYPEQFGAHKFVSHGCGLPGTRSLLGVFPEHNAAVVISVLVAGAEPALSDLVGKLFGVGRMVQPRGIEKSELSAGAPWDAFVEHFAGPSQLPPVDPNTEGPDISDIVGTYWTERRSLNSAATLYAAGSTIDVKMTGAGTIELGGRSAVEIAPGVFDLENKSRYVFRKVGDEMYMHSGPSSSFRRFTGLSNPSTAVTGLMIGFATLLTLILVPLWPSRSTLEKRVRTLGYGGLALVFALPIALFAGYDTMTDVALVDGFNGDLTRLFLVLMIINLVIIVGLAFVLAACFAWRRHAGNWRHWFWRGHLTLLALGAVLSWPGYVLFNMLGLQL